MPLLSVSVGFSKSAAVLKLSTPLFASIANRPASAPPLIEKVGVSPSASLAAIVVTLVWFSITLMAAVAPPPSEVIVGASLVLSTTMVKLCAPLNEPSETVSTTS